MRIFLVILIALMLLVGVIVWGIQPGGYLRAIGNQRYGSFLEAFGFKRPLPSGYLQPACLIMRLFSPYGGKSVDDYRTQLAKFGSGPIEIEYMPDQTWIVLSRSPNPSRALTFERFAKSWSNSGHGIKDWPIRYLDAISNPLFYKRSFTGKEYDCAEVRMAFDGHPARNYKQSEIYQGLLMQRTLPSKQVLSVQVFTPGDKLNFDVIELLLDCLDL